MAIVKMKRLHMLALESDRNKLFSELQSLGVLEVSQQTEKLSDPEWSALVHRDESLLAAQQDRLDAVTQALSILDRHAPEKTSLFADKPSVDAEALFDESGNARTEALIQALDEGSQQLAATEDQILRTTASAKALVPWLSLDVPLETRSPGTLYTAFGTMPATVDLQLVRDELAQGADASCLYAASADTDVHYLFFLCHKSIKEDALEILKANSFSNVTFKDLSGTAQENFDRYTQSLEQLEAQKAELSATLTGYAQHRSQLQLLYDRLSQEAAKEACKERLLTTDRSFFLSGWLPADTTGKLEELLSRYDCAYSLTDPTEEEIPDVPVKLKNGPLTRCMNTVTEMYSLPAYDGIDPNPVMAPFFILFYGIMMADMAYGLLMIFGCLFILKKVPLKESMRNFFELFMLCGVATFIVGAMTGGFFGDFIPQLLKMINPESTFQLPALFTPLNDTIAILIGSMVLGFIQIITGMAISVWKKCKDGCFQDALWDEITWWIILAGAALAILGIGSVAGYPVVLIIGCLMLLYGGTRNAKGFGKVTALIGVVYNGISGYFSDILSYLRLMALMLSGSVIASVFNTLGAAMGNVVVFIIIALIGNMLNLVLNLLGCYVHDLRLQCLEYFNRFYKDGGKAYKPLAIDTKYFNIIKEEH